MANSLPEWAQWITTFSTPVVAVFVAWIAWRQWRTAREKLILDLFEKRWEIYSAAEQAVSLVMRDADTRRNSAIFDIAVLRSKAGFLFGEDVSQYLADMQRRMADIAVAAEMMSEQDHEKNWAAIKGENLQAIVKFGEEFSKLCAPYMGMKSKL